MYSAVAQKNKIKPKLAFLGVGWIGKNRMQAIINSGVGEFIRAADSSSEVLSGISAEFPSAFCSPEFDDILNDESIDAVIIATPSAVHAAQSIAALERGKSVFCQKPLARNYEETAAVISTASAHNKLLGVDLSYRYTAAFQKLHEIILSGSLGNIYSVNLIFHNAYGPGKEWFYNKELSGGGSLIDLGIHLVDLTLYSLNFPDVRSVSASLYSGGRKLVKFNDEVEDYVQAQIEFDNDVTASLTTSWKMNAGRQAIIEATFIGTKGSAAFKNINGSFYDFITELYEGTTSRLLISPPDDWMGRAAVEWVKKLSNSNQYDPEAELFLRTAKVLDLIYGRIKY